MGKSSTTAQFRRSTFTANKQKKFLTIFSSLISLSELLILSFSSALSAAVFSHKMLINARLNKPQPTVEELWSHHSDELLFTCSQPGASAETIKTFFRLKGYTFTRGTYAQRCKRLWETVRDYKQSPRRFHRSVRDSRHSSTQSRPLQTPPAIGDKTQFPSLPPVQQLHAHSGTATLQAQKPREHITSSGAQNQ